MPYVEGESLRHRLRREIQLPVEEAVRDSRHNPSSSEPLTPSPPFQPSLIEVRSTRLDDKLNGSPERHRFARSTALSQTAPPDPFNQMMDPHSHIAPEELAAYVDGRAGSSEWDRMTSHLATCQACLRELLAVVRLLRHGPGSRDGA